MCATYETEKISADGFSFLRSTSHFAVAVYSISFHVCVHAAPRGGSWSAFVCAGPSSLMSRTLYKQRRRERRSLQRVREIETDYLVVGASASGMAFADTLVANSALDHIDDADVADSPAFMREHTRDALENLERTATVATHAR